MGVKKPLYPEQVYERVRQNLKRKELRKIAEYGGRNIVERQKYLARQPHYATGDVSAQALQYQQRELFGELATLASEGAKTTRASRRSSRHLLKPKVTKKLSKVQGISGMQRGEMEFVPGRQAGFEPFYEVESPSGSSYRREVHSQPGFNRYEAATQSAELNTLLAESGRLAGVPITYSGKPPRRGGRYGTSGPERNVPADRLQRIQQASKLRAQSGLPPAAQARSTTLHAELTGGQDHPEPQYHVLGTKGSVGAGTSLGN